MIINLFVLTNYLYKMITELLPDLDKKAIRFSKNINYHQLWQQIIAPITLNITYRYQGIRNNWCASWFKELTPFILLLTRNRTNKFYISGYRSTLHTILLSVTFSVLSSQILCRIMRQSFLCEVWVNETDLSAGCLSYWKICA